MRRIFVITLLIVLFSFSFAAAHGEDSFAEAERIIKEKAPCSELTENELEILGDYFMEQMHPGEVHEIMDERMGGEGSESLRQAHVNMGKAFYCGEHEAFSGGMMDVMMNRNRMMDYSYSGLVRQGVSVIFMIALIIALVLIIVLLANKLKK